MVKEFSKNRLGFDKVIAISWVVHFRETQRIYVCLSADFHRCKRLQRPSDQLPVWRIVSTNSIGPDCGCR